MLRTMCVFLLLCVPAFACDGLCTDNYTVTNYRVIDGDTIETELDLGFEIRIVRSIRPFGIDTPERSTRAGKLVSLVVQSWCQKQETLTATFLEGGKFHGRYIGELHGDTERLSAFLVRAGLALAYDGGRKTEWTTERLRAVEEKAQGLLITTE